MTTVLRQRGITRPDILPAIRIIRRASYGTPLVALVLAGRGIVETRVVIRMAIGKNSQRAVGVVVLVAAEEVIHACCAGGATGVGIWAGGVVYGAGAVAVVTYHIVWFVLSLGGKRRMRMTF